ncbi:hypothetical protein B0H66DRAFT_537447 [Apodospora peruviana]|uniref:C2H2-type domain-containing protein n=1 Tax=Apodospora peruviana TaxID=516989 RepID=A0AAE0HX47_9PEZI|nr:hypothetical protein B0H66DRAFT_537447 [Apodospora peruviana]
MDPLILAPDISSHFTPTVATPLNHSTAAFTNHNVQYLNIYPLTPVLVTPFDHTSTSFTTQYAQDPHTSLSTPTTVSPSDFTSTTLTNAFLQDSNIPLVTPSATTSLPSDQPYVNGPTPPSSPSSPSIHSLTDDFGNSKRGHIWCCEKWVKCGADLNRHNRTKNHNPPLTCKADSNCNHRKGQKRDMDRHYWSAHKRWAEANAIPPQEEKCLGCGRVYARKDFLKRHLDKNPCRAQRQS